MTGFSPFNICVYLCVGAGVFFLSCAEAEQISFLFDCIVRGISPSRGPFGLKPLLPGQCYLTVTRTVCVILSDKSLICCQTPTAFKLHASNFD